MISSRYGVMSVSLDALDSVFILKLVLVLHNFENLFVVWHFLFSWEEPTNAFLFLKLEPGVRTNILD